MYVYKWKKTFDVIYDFLTVAHLVFDNPFFYFKGYVSHSEQTNARGILRLIIYGISRHVLSKLDDSKNLATRQRASEICEFRIINYGY